MPYQIIYSSEAATPMQLEDLEDILEHARSSNAASGITGALVYSDGVFLQILEGDAQRVKELMFRIASDVRHGTITVLKQSEIPAAQFLGWEMAYVSATAAEMAQWAGIAETSTAPAVLGEIRRDPDKLTRIARSILQQLSAADPGADEAAERPRH